MIASVTRRNIRHIFSPKRSHGETILNMPKGRPSIQSVQRLCTEKQIFCATVLSKSFGSKGEFGVSDGI